MKESLLIYFQNIEDDKPQWSLVNDSQESSSVRTELDELKFKSRSLRVCVVIPATGFSCYEIDVKTNNSKKIVQAASFFLEDRLLDEPENLFFALDKKPNSVPRIWVCNKELIKSWLEHLGKLGLKADCIIPESALLEPVVADYALWLLPDKSMLHDGLNFAYLGKNNIEQVLDSMITDVESEQDIVTCEVNMYADDLRFYIENNENISFDIKSYADSSSFFNRLSKCLSNNQTFSLLQGEYAKQGHLVEKLKPWRLVAALVLILGGLHFFTLAYDIYHLQKQQIRLQSQMQNIYSGVFPIEKMPADPYKTMKEKLKNIKFVAKDGKNTISMMLSDMSELLDSKITIENVTFSGSKAKVKMKSLNMSQIEDTASKIDNKKYKAKILSVSEKGSSSEGILEISSQ